MDHIRSEICLLASAFDACISVKVIEVSEQNLQKKSRIKLVAAHNDTAISDEFEYLNQ